METRPKVSCAIPIHNMENAAFFLRRLMQSLERQTFKDFEIVITKEDGTMAQNTNAAIKKCKGELIKILYMDDYLAHESALENMVESFKSGWLATGCIHDNGAHLFNTHYPAYNDEIHLGKNTIGSPSVIMIENKEPLLFDETMNWLLDCDYYKRLHARYGKPTLLQNVDVVIGVGKHQTTHKLTDEEKLSEHDYLNQKYGE